MSANNRGSDSFDKLVFDESDAWHVLARERAVKVHARNTMYGYGLYRSFTPRVESGEGLNSYISIWYMCVYHSSLSQEPDAPDKHILMRAHRKLGQHLRYLGAQKRALPTDGEHYKNSAYHHAKTLEKTNKEQAQRAAWIAERYIWEC